MTNEELIKQHDADSNGMSVMHGMRRVSSTYKEIIAKGHSIVPDILEYLKKKEGGMSIMLLLWDITNESPYTPERINEGPMAGYNVKAARAAWLEWVELYLKRKEV